jgi:hypothetical protein
VFRRRARVTAHEIGFTASVNVTPSDGQLVNLLTKHLGNEIDSQVDGSPPLGWLRRTALAATRLIC